jgi:hypothetical protein
VGGLQTGFSGKCEYDWEKYLWEHWLVADVSAGKRAFDK